MVEIDFKKIEKIVCSLANPDIVGINLASSVQDALIAQGICYENDELNYILEPEDKLDEDDVDEDYVSFETAKLLKENGFHSYNCHTAYDSNGEFFWYGDYEKDRIGVIDAPTLQMACKWLRIYYHLQITLDIPHTTQIRPKYYCIIRKNLNQVSYITDFFDSPEQVYDEAIKYCLENIV